MDVATHQFYVPVWESEILLSKHQDILASLYYLSIIIMLPIYFGYPFFLCHEMSILNSVYSFVFLFFFSYIDFNSVNSWDWNCFIYILLWRDQMNERSNNTNGRQAASVRGRKCGSVLGAWEWRKYCERRMWLVVSNITQLVR